jgi:hypothetical protein
VTRDQKNLEKVFGRKSLRAFTYEIENGLFQISMFGETNFLIEPKSSFIERWNWVQGIPHTIMSKTAIVPDIL